MKKAANLAQLKSLHKTFSSKHDVKVFISSMKSLFLLSFCFLPFLSVNVQEDSAP